MSDQPESEQAYRLVGEFMFWWGVVEYRITSAIKALLDLEKVQGNIILANVAFRDKTSMLSTFAELILRPSAPAKADEARKLLSDIVEFSGNYRNTLVHNPFVPNDLDGIELLRIKAKRKYEVPKTIWDKLFFETRYTELRDFSFAIRELTAELIRRDASAKIAQELFLPKEGSYWRELFGPHDHPPEANTDSPLPPTTPEKDAQTPEDHQE